MKKILLSLLWLAVFGSAKAQTFDEDLRTYFQLIGLEQFIQNGVKEIQTQAAWDTTTLSPAQRDTVNEIVKIALEDFKTMLLEMHKQHYTQEDIRRLIQFCNSPVGQKVIHANDSLTEEHLTELNQFRTSPLGQKLVSFSDLMDSREVDSLAAWEQRFETRLYAALYGMTPKKKHGEAELDRNFQDQLSIAQDSTYSATDALNMEAIWKAYQADSSNVELKQGGASLFNGFAWNQLLTGQYEKAAQTLKMGLQMDVMNLYLHTNVPLCYLLQGKYEMAKKLYLEFQDKPFGELGLELYRDAFLDDLRQFQKAKLIPVERLADVEKIKALLSKGILNSEKTGKP